MAASTYDPNTDPVIARIRNAPTDADTFERIHRIASRKASTGAMDGSNVCLIESIAERIENTTRDPLALAVRMICNAPWAACHQMDAIAAATEARAALKPEAA